MINWVLVGLEIYVFWVIGCAYYSVCMHVSRLLRHNLDFYKLSFGRIRDLDLLGGAKKVGMQTNLYAYMYC